MSAVERAARAICASENEIWDEASQASRDRWMREASADIGKPISGLLICDGCGCTTTDAELAAQREARPGLISCCPERKMRPATREDWDKLRASKDAAPVSAGKVKALVERLRSYEDAWGDLPSIPPHSATAPGYTTGRVLLDVLEAASILSALQPGDGWQGIEAMPDEIEVLVWAPGWDTPSIAITTEGVGPYDPISGGDFEPAPTHWMPLPAPPSALSQEGGE